MEVQLFMLRAGLEVLLQPGMREVRHQVRFHYLLEDLCSYTLVVAVAVDIFTVAVAVGRVCMVEAVEGLGPHGLLVLVGAILVVLRGRVIMVRELLVVNIREGVVGIIPPMRTEGQVYREDRGHPRPLVTVQAAVVEAMVVVAEVLVMCPLRGGVAGVLGQTVRQVPIPAEQVRKHGIHRQLWDRRGLGALVWG